MDYTQMERDIMFGNNAECNDYYSVENDIMMRRTVKEVKDYE